MFFFFKQKTAYEMRISDWSSDVCSSDLTRWNSMAGTAVLDPIDRLILRTLQEDGRTTNVALSEKVGLTAPPCLRRVRSLEESGIIRGYHARLDPERLGYGITVFAMVSLKSQAEADLRAFEEDRKSTRLN